MKTPNIYNKYLADGEIPMIVVFQALYSVCWRFANTIRRKQKCISAQEAIEFHERYGRYEKRYPLQRDILLNILDKYELRDRYSEFNHHVAYTCLNDLISAQYVTKLINALQEGGTVLIDKKQNDSRNIKDSLLCEENMREEDLRLKGYLNS